MSVVASSSSKMAESQWSHLPSDILKVILNRLNNCLDVGSSDSCGALSIHNLRLRSVCKSWRSFIPIRIKTIAKFSIVPNFTFEQLKFNPRQGHYTISQSTIYLIRKHQPFLTTSKGNYWLLRVEEETSLDGIKRGEKWRPLNPLSRTLTSDDEGKKRLILPKGFPKSINLLNFDIFEIGRAYNLDFVNQALQQDNIDDDGFVRIDKVVVSSTPFSENSDHAAAVDYMAVMAICGLQLFFLKIGDKQWIPVDDPKNSGFIDVVFHRGEFYALDYLGMVVSVGSDLKAKLIAPGFGYLQNGGQCKNLVTCGRNLFMINTSFQSETFVDYDYYMDEVIMQETDPVRLEVYKLNEEKKQWERVGDLNNHVFFVGYDCSYSVFAGDFVGLKPNCVYYYVDESFRDCNEENKLGEFFTGIGVYDLDAGTCGPLSNFPDHWPIFMPPTISGIKSQKNLVGGSSSKVEPQWSQLPSDILKVLVNRLNNCLDVGSPDYCGALSIHNLRLRAVCREWRSSIPIRSENVARFLPNFTLSLLKFKPRQGHYTLSQSIIYLLHQHQLQQPSVSKSKGHYWLLRVEEEASPNGIYSGEKWSLLNPLSRTLTSFDDGKKRILLPKGFPKSINLLDFHIFEIGRAYNIDFQTSQKCGIDEVGFVRIDKVVVSSSPFSENSGFDASEVDYLAVMAICGLKLVFLKLGDENWIPVDDPKDSAFMDVVFHKGKFYAVDYKGKLVSVGCDLAVKEMAPEVGYLFDGGETKNLVTSGGDLFMIDTFQTKQFDAQDYFMDPYVAQQTKTVRLKIYKLHEEKKEWERVRDLCNHVFFVGFDCSYSVFAGDFVGLKPNCVYYYVDDYFRDPFEENKLGEYFTGIGVYDMDAGTCGPLEKFPDHWPIFMPPSTFSKLRKLATSVREDNLSLGLPDALFFP